MPEKATGLTVHLFPRTLPELCDLDNKPANSKYSFPTVSELP